MKDYYEILGVTKNASADEIKHAYRRMAMKYHPDRNPSDKTAETKFKDAKEAYEILSDTQKRAAYDQFGQAGVSGMGAGGFGGAGAQGFGGFDGFGDIFGNIFEEVFKRAGGGEAHSGPERGADLGYNLTLDLEQAVFGTEIKIKIPTLINCSECGGSGAKKGTRPIACKTCGGSGMVQIQQGFFTLQQTCPKCHGQGTIITDPCSKCRGKGRLRTEKTLSVHIPAGIDSGDRIRLAGEGEAGSRGGTAGDLYVQVSLKPHPIFKREGNDLYCEMPITFAAAALGGELDVPTLEGRVKLKIPPETQSGKTFRLRNKGVKASHGHYAGDLFCNVTVETPVNLSGEQKELLQKFSASIERDSKDHTPRSRSWFDSVKKFFEK